MFVPVALDGRLPVDEGGGSVVISAPVMSGLSSDFRVGQGAGAGAKAGEGNEASDLGGPLDVGVQ